MAASHAVSSRVIPTIMPGTLSPNPKHCLNPTIRLGYRMRTALSALLVVALAATPVFAHGGQYKGPSDAGGGNSASGGTVAPPTNPGGAAAPGPGAGTAGAATSTGAGTSGGRGSRGGSGRTSATTGAGTLSDAKGFEVWEFWWENNKDRFLNLKDRLISNTTVSGGTGALTGRGRKVTQGSSRRPSDAMIENEVIPALLELVKQSQDRDILDSAILALGRTTKPGNADQIVDAAMPLLAHSELSVQSSTALTLGVLGSPKATEALKNVLQDNSDGRRLTGGGSVHWLVRAFSALSLGLIGDADSMATLQDVVVRLGDKDKDIKVCAIVALGLVGEDLADDAADFLVEQLADKRMDPLIASYIPTSLGKLNATKAVGPLLNVFTDRDSDNLLVQSAAIGLGQLAGIENDGVVEALLDYVKEGKDQQSRHFSLISLAQIGARDEDVASHAEAHEAITGQLGKEIQGKGKSKDHRSWAALAGAIYSRSQEASQPDFITRIKAAYTKESNPSFKSSFAVALGLLNDYASAEDIFNDFKKRKETDFRGYASIALGFMNYTDASDALRGLSQNKGTTPTLRLQAATGLGLMSDTQAVGTLIETLKTASTLGVSSAVAKALGLIGDRDSIGPLKEVATDESQQKLTRAFACVALGIVGEKTDLPWNAVISANNNYRAKTPSIEEVLDIL